MFFYENKEALSKRVDALRPLVTGDQGLAGKSTLDFFQSFMENVSQLQLVSATRKDLGFGEKFTDADALTYILSTTQQLEDTSAWTTIKGERTFKQVIKTLAGHLALDKSHKGHFNPTRVRRVAAFGNQTSKADNPMKGKRGAPKYGDMPWNLYGRLDEDEKDTFRTKGTVPDWYAGAAKDLETETKGNRKDPGDYPIAKTKSVTFSDKEDGTKSTEHSVVDLSAKKSKKRNRYGDNNKRSKYAKGAHTAGKGGKKRDSESASKGNSKSKRTRRVVVNIDSDTDAISIQSSDGSNE